MLYNNHRRPVLRSEYPCKSLPFQYWVRATGYVVSEIFTYIQFYQNDGFMKLGIESPQTSRFLVVCDIHLYLLKLIIHQFINTDLINWSDQQDYLY